MDENNFKSLFESNIRKVYNISLNIVRNAEDAEDISQEVFIEVYRSMEKFREDASVSTWIYRIAVNKSLDFLKAKKRKKRFALITRLFHPDSGELQHDLPHFDHPGVILENKERSAFLFKAIEKLPDMQKSAFILFKIEGFSQKKVAEILQLSEKAVESLVQRGRDQIKKNLGNLYNGRGI